MKMIKLLLTIAILLVTVTTATAAGAVPWLVANVPAAPLPTYYLLTGIPGATGHIPYVTGADSSGTTWVKLYNVSTLTVGTTYTVTVQACTVWGCSAASAPFSFTPAAPPAVPTGVGIADY